MTDSLISVENLTKSYTLQNGHSFTVLNNLSFSTPKGTLTAITGESGSGKSSFLHVLGALDRFDKGAVSVCGYNLETLQGNELDNFRNQHLGFVFQFHYLLPDFNAVENVALPFLAHKFRPAKARRYAEDLLDLVGLHEKRKEFPSYLSGGEQQRVAIARALINRPSLLLADEPTGNLDRENANRIYSLLERLNKDLNLSIVIVTHNHEIAKKTDLHFKLLDGTLVSSPLTQSQNPSPSEDFSMDNL